MSGNRFVQLIRDILASPILSTILGTLSIGISFALVNGNSGLPTAIFVSTLMTLFTAVLIAYFYFRERPRTSFRLLYSKLTWEIFDEKGLSSNLVIQQTLKCLHNNIYTYKLTSYGDGTITNLESNFGKPIHTFFDGGKRYDIFLLNRTYNKGDMFIIEITKKIEGSFLSPEEWVENEILHETEHSELSITFPKNRHPTDRNQVWLAHKFAGSTETKILPDTCYSYNVDGNLIINYRITHPKLGSIYQIRWHW